MATVAFSRIFCTRRLATGPSSRCEKRLRLCLLSSAFAIGVVVISSFSAILQNKQRYTSVRLVLVGSREQAAENGAVKGRRCIGFRVGVRPYWKWSCLQPTREPLASSTPTARVRRAGDLIPVR